MNTLITRYVRLTTITATGKRINLQQGPAADRFDCPHSDIRRLGKWASTVCEGRKL
jgi:hypothetical protein